MLLFPNVCKTNIWLQGDSCQESQMSHRLYTQICHRNLVATTGGNGLSSPSSLVNRVVSCPKLAIYFSIEAFIALS